MAAAPARRASSEHRRTLLETHGLTVTLRRPARRRRARPRASSDGPARRADRTERRRQDDVHRRHHRLRPGDRAASRSPAEEIEPVCPPTGAPGSAWRAPGSRSSCSTTSPSPRTCASRPSASRSAGFLADLVWPRRRRDHGGCRAARSTCSASADLPRRDAERDQPGPAQARRRRPARWPRDRGWSAWTSRPPASTPPSAAALGAQPARDRRRRYHRSFSSTTTWASCSTCATTST